MLFRRIQRSKSYLTDVTFVALRPWATGKADYVQALVKRHHKCGEKLIDRDIAIVRRWAGEIEQSSFRMIKTHFSDGEVLSKRTV